MTFTKLAPTLYEVSPCGAHIRLRIGTGRGGFEMLLDTEQAALLAESLSER